ncbi:hypothetical protein BG004_007500 [Podila humilis]|nr:hypothetical protein BG004_007500 [Podila humilis]
MHILFSLTFATIVSGIVFVAGLFYVPALVCCIVSAQTYTHRTTTKMQYQWQDHSNEGSDPYDSSHVLDTLMSSEEHCTTSQSVKKEVNDYSLVSLAETMAEKVPKFSSLAYLTTITSENPLATLRFVFMLGHLPENISDLSRILSDLCTKHTVGISVIPDDALNTVATTTTSHEQPDPDPDQDIVLVFSGTLDRILDAIHDYFLCLVPVSGRRQEHVWNVCVLVPHRIHFLFIGSYDRLLTYDEINDMAESSVPQLRRVHSRRYGPVSREECMLTMESPHLEHILDALYCVAEILKVDQRFFGTLDGGYYCGGTPSRIPLHRPLSTTTTTKATKIHMKTPLGYLVRPEVKKHFPNTASRDSHLKDVLLTVVDTVQVFVKRNVEMCWKVSVYVPQRVVDVLVNDETRQILDAEGVSVQVLSLKEAEQRIRSDEERLRGPEVESVAVMSSTRGRPGLVHGLEILFDTMYGY